MAEKLIIYAEAGKSQAHWAVLSNVESNVIDEGRAELSNLHQHAKNRNLIVVIPAHEVTLTHVTVPTKSINQARLAIPNIMEDELIDDIENLHFAVQKTPVDNQYQVGVISKSRLRAYVELFEEQGLKVNTMISSLHALPIREGSWSVLLHNDECTVRTEATEGFVCETELLNFYLEKALNTLESEQDTNTQKPELWLLNSGQAESMDLQLEAWVCKESSFRNRLWIYAQGLAQAKKDVAPLNLLQGEFKPVRAQSQILKNWLPTLVLLGFMLVGWLAYMAFEGFRLEHKNQELQRTIEKTYKAAFPGSRLVDSSRLKRQIENKLNKLRGGGKGSDFLQKTQGILNVVRDSKATLRMFSMRQHDFQVEVSTPTLSDLDALKNQLTQKGFDAQIKATETSDESKVFGTLNIK